MWDNFCRWVKEVEIPILQIIAVVCVVTFVVDVSQGDYHGAMTDVIIAVLAGIYILR
jgi:hypothetical protein